MPTAVSSPYAGAAWQRLARHEQLLLRMPALPIATTLWIHADADWSARHEPAPLLTQLHPCNDRLEGDLVCHRHALPIERDSVQTIVVQHAADRIADVQPLLDELCRVLEPGGQLFWFGLNPVSAWSAWTLWQSRQSGGVHPRSLREVDRRLAAHAVDAVDSRYLGALWPQAEAINEARRSTLVDGLRGAWLLSARKRRAVLTPLRAPARLRRLRTPALSAIPSSRNPS